MFAQRPSKRQLPPCVRRLWLWFLLPFAVVCLAVIAISAGGMNSLSPAAKPAVFIPALFVPQFAAMFLVWRGLRRARLAFAACDGLLCAACLYDMRGHASATACPECGRAFDPARDRTLWEACGMPRKPMGTQS